MPIYSYSGPSFYDVHKWNSIEIGSIVKPGFYKKCVDDILAVFEFSSGADTSYSYLNIKHKNTCHEKLNIFKDNCSWRW